MSFSHLRSRAKYFLENPGYGKTKEGLIDLACRDCDFWKEDELEITVNAVEKWKAGDRYPNNSKAILTLLDQISKRKRIPKKRRYKK